MNTLTTLVLVALAAVWLWVLGRPLLMNLLNAARRDPVGNFNRKMSVLGEAPQRSLAHEGASSPFGAPKGLAGSPLGGANALGGARSAVRKRRLTIFLALVMCVVVSAILAIAFRGLFIWNNLIFDIALVGYTVLAARAGAAETERASKVAFIDPVRSSGSVQIQAVAER